MGILLSAVAGGLQGASHGLDSMEAARQRRVAQARQDMLDQISRQNIDADNKRADAQLDMQREEGGFVKGADGNWSFDPSNTREARVAKIRDVEEAKKISANEIAYIASGMSPQQAAAAARNPGLADNFLFPKPDPVKQALQIHKGERQIDVSMPLPVRESANSPDNKKETWVRQRAIELTKPQGTGYKQQPGLPLAQALNQASQEWAMTSGESPAPAQAAAPVASDPLNRLTMQYENALRSGKDPAMAAQVYAREKAKLGIK